MLAHVQTRQSTPLTKCARQSKVRSHLPPPRRPPFRLLFSPQHLFFPPLHLSRARSFHPRSPRCCFPLTLSRRRRRRRQRRRHCLQCFTTNSGHRPRWPPLRRRRRRPLPSSSPSCPRLSVTVRVRRCRLNCRFPSKKSVRSSSTVADSHTLGSAVTFTSPTLEMENMPH